MVNMFFRSALLVALVMTTTFALLAQAPPHDRMEREDNLAPDDFTNIVKEAWTFLKNELEALTNATATKTEFETSQEFEQRVATARQEYLAKVSKFYKDKKFDQREFGVLFKAELVSYDADNLTYRITSNTVVEIPYDIPWLDVSLVDNGLVALADSIARGYRSTSMYLKMTPPLRFEVPRDLAKSVKTDEANLYFRVRLTVNALQESFSNQASLTMYAHYIQLFNKKSNVVYWEQRL